MEKPIKILQITGGLNMGGIENFIMNIYRNIDRDKVQFDFLIHQEEKQIFEDEIKSLGGKVYRISSIKKIGYFRYKKELKKFFKKNKYKVIHSHYNELSGLILQEAKKCGIKNLISHSHTSYPNYKNAFFKIISKYFLKKLRNRTFIKFSCSKKAGEWLYGKNENYEVINNGINPEEYLYNQEKREYMRKKLALSQNDIVLGHIGRFSSEKNHIFLIEIFKELSKINENYRLFLIGDGDTRKDIEEKVEKLELGTKAKFLGVRKDVKDILQGLDMFVLPSIFEGLPVTLVEAQGAGLKCFISDSITKEIDLECGLTEFISLKKSAKEWAEIIDKNKEYIRKNTIVALQNHGYDMTKNAKELEKKYIQLYNS